jgi:hypothetical protein
LPIGLHNHLDYIQIPLPVHQSHIVLSTTYNRVPIRIPLRHVILIGIEISVQKPQANVLDKLINIELGKKQVLDLFVSELGRTSALQRMKEA